jgi:glutathione S-transferase
VRFQIDATRWPRTAAWMARTLAQPAFAKLAKIEDAVLRTPIAEQRAALRALGAPVSAETYAGLAPRRGVMPV